MAKQQTKASTSKRARRRSSHHPVFLGQAFVVLSIIPADPSRRDPRYSTMNLHLNLQKVRDSLKRTLERNPSAVNLK
ncbi:unnamed protein product [Hermetia illucens]|uniref:Uncharacterized protein n=1 Tax=Hermetia illucens TaxID=343691 RepID=A0A7R8V4Q2_HERIL|nr:unnamed protein product [Hermetia illucens]